MLLFKVFNMILMAITWTNVEVEVPVYNDISEYIIIPQATLKEDGVIIEDADMYYVYNGVNNTYYNDINTNYLGLVRHTIKVVFPNYHIESKQEIVFKIVDKVKPVINHVPEFTILVNQQIPDLSVGLEYSDNYNPVQDLTVNILGTETIDNTRVGIYQFFYQVIDKSMNATLIASYIKVIDTSPPVIEKTKELKLEVGQYFDVFYFYKITDNHDTYLDVVVDDDLVNYSKPGSYPIKITATDSSGNATVRQDSLLIMHTEKPILKLYQTTIDLDVGTTNLMNILKDNIKEVSDKVDKLSKDDVNINHIINKDKLGIYDVSYIVTNSSGTTTEVFGKVNVVDQIKPTIEVIKPIEIPYGAVSFIFFEYFKISDNYDLYDDLTITVNQKINFKVLGAYPITVEVVDKSKNKAILEEIAYVFDNEKPVFLLDVDTIELEVFSTYDFTKISVKDNYDDNPKIYPKSYQFNEIGTFTTNLQLEDSSGNTNYKELTFIILDLENPIINLSTKEVKLPLNSDKLNPSDYLVEVFDNYDSLTLKDVVVIDNVNYEKLGRYEIVYYLGDHSMNETIEKINVIIDDTKAPFIKTNNITIKKGTKFNLFDDVTVIEEGEYELNSYPSSINTNEIGTYHITYLAVDKRGNIGRTERVITITDNSQSYKVPIYIAINFVVIGSISVGVYVFLNKKRNI